MCPQRFAPKSYDAAKLKVLQDAFDQAWKVLQLRFPDCSEAEEERIKMVLAKAIVELSVQGIFDPGELLKLSLKGVLATNRPPIKKRKPRIA